MSARLSYRQQFDIRSYPTRTPVTSDNRADDRSVQIAILSAIGVSQEIPATDQRREIDMAIHPRINDGHRDSPARCQTLGLGQ